ncbi:hypothetical protein [uncultured Alistipes sp.]|uniref:hypothetical protein n=1 Tax=uncultured Alistipes sp. TaxID=538949 RepID=UPI0026034B4D|nr:hypothetical protein [uncultured Alistipes sp.]
MKKILLIAALAAVLPWSAGAQVEKQVEVTKAYVPSLESATKLAMVPDMTDTTRMRPEIDYSITPLTMSTVLATRPIRPATVTYWEFNRPKPFYLKAGAGYPLNSVLDFYASTQNPGTGYVVGYVNHEGLYGKLCNDWGEKNTATRMLNRIGAAAGKYFGRRTLEGELSYENRMYHRHGAGYAATVASEALWQAFVHPGRRLDYGDANLAVRFGDDFQDLSRTNFEVALRGGLFFDHSDHYADAEAAREIRFGASARVGRAFGKHRLSLEAAYDRHAGRKALDGAQSDLIRAGARYGVDGGVVRFEAGADYCYDRTQIGGEREGRSYIFPFARLDFDLGAPGIRPFVEVDGGLETNDFRSLTLRNPYLAGPMWGDRSSADYNARAGIGGSLWRGKVNYRLYAGFSIRDDHLYWIAARSLFFRDGGQEAEVDFAHFLPVRGRQTVGSLRGEVEYRPVTGFLLTLGGSGYLYNDEEQYANGEPAFRGDVALRYEGRRISFGAGVAMQSRREWTVLTERLSVDGTEAGAPTMSTYAAPFDFDLKVDFAWRASQSVELFAEGSNLAGRDLYLFPGYRDFGARVTVGIKMVF